ncbi:MAG: DUF554 domain-containing protein [Clostridiaceae bacterium]
MFGTIVNVIAILIGSLCGSMFGKQFPDKVKNTIIQGVGLAILLIGIQMALETKNVLLLISCLVIGGFIGEIIDIEFKLERLGKYLESKLSKHEEGNFTKAFVTTSLIYCVGAMAIVGSLEGGLNGNYDILFAKSMLDGITAIIFASSLGIGVMFSAIPVLLYQGLITISAGFLEGVISDFVIGEVSAVGGLLIFGIGINILGIKEIKVGNLLPGVLIAVPLSVLVEMFM